MITTTEELNTIMDKDPLSLSPDDITQIVAYHRRNREAGPRPKRETGPTPKIDLGALKLTSPTVSEPIKRRI